LPNCNGREIRSMNSSGLSRKRANVWPTIRKLPVAAGGPVSVRCRTSRAGSRRFDDVSRCAPSRVPCPAIIDKKIIRVFHTLLERVPDNHEMLHWATYLKHGVEVDEMAASIVATYEFQNRKANQRKVLVELPGFKWLPRPAITTSAGR